MFVFVDPTDRDNCVVVCDEAEANAVAEEARR